MRVKHQHDHELPAGVLTSGQIHFPLRIVIMMFVDHVWAEVHKNRE